MILLVKWVYSNLVLQNKNFIVFLFFILYNVEDLKFVCKQIGNYFLNYFFKK